ncbi:MAG: hypothetical protein J3K34DRAFT_424769 [Monoraphidium minutum]|nr:MAG: hypothetical protein J3K34DRAFT_424769 [Monoraphidium minutum]
MQAGGHQHGRGAWRNSCLGCADRKRPPRSGRKGRGRRAARRGAARERGRGAGERRGPRARAAASGRVRPPQLRGAGGARARAGGRFVQSFGFGVVSAGQGKNGSGGSRRQNQRAGSIGGLQGGREARRKTGVGAGAAARRRRLAVGCGKPQGVGRRPLWCPLRPRTKAKGATTLRFPHQNHEIRRTRTHGGTRINRKSLIGNIN